jgi:hypothetical protein
MSPAMATVCSEKGDMSGTVVFFHVLPEHPETSSADNSTATVKVIKDAVFTLFIFSLLNIFARMWSYLQPRPCSLQRVFYHCFAET